MPSLYEQFGEIDIYLFDQLLRGRILPSMRILDAGCGGGRNLIYFLQNNFSVSGVDADPVALAEVTRIASRLQPQGKPDFRCERIETMSFPAASFDLVIANAVLHFAMDEAHFRSMLDAMWKVLKPGGLLFCRLASSVALQHQHVAGRRFISPDGAERFLVDDAYLLHLTRQLAGELADPIKTTVIQDQRCMTTWVLRKTGDERLAHPRL